MIAWLGRFFAVIPVAVIATVGIVLIAVVGTWAYLEYTANQFLKEEQEENE